MSSSVRALEAIQDQHYGRWPGPVGSRSRDPNHYPMERRQSGSRRGLIETPARVARALEEAFAGYAQDPNGILRKSFDEIEGYDEMIALRGVRFVNHCEHHMAPINGQVWVGYVRDGRVVGISKLARVVEVYAKRLQIQERLTSQIANAINNVLRPRGVGVVVRASHSLHDRAGRAQGGYRFGHEPNAGLLPRESSASPRISWHDRLKAKRKSQSLETSILLGRIAN